MSVIDGIGGSSSPVSTDPTGLAALTSEEFLNIILTELQAQDPLEPQDTEALLSQFSTLYQIESDLKLSDNLGELVNQNEFTAAAFLIGSLVSGISTDNRRVADVVVSVTNTKDGPVLNLFDGSQVLFSNVDEVAGAVTFEGDGAADGDNDGDGSGDASDDADDGTGDAGDASGDGAGVTPSDADAAGSSGASGSGSGGVGDAGGELGSQATTGDRIDQLVAALKGQF